jgi:hypothetical protein
MRDLRPVTHGLRFTHHDSRFTHSKSQTTTHLISRRTCFFLLPGQLLAQ